MGWSSGVCQPARRISCRYHRGGNERRAKISQDSHSSKHHWVQDLTLLEPDILKAFFDLIKL